MAGSQRAIVNHVISLIDSTPAGREISVSMYAFDDQAVADALIRASRERGVRVRVVIDAKFSTRMPAQALANSVYANISSGSTSALRHPPIKRYELNDGTRLVHSKYLLVEGTYAGQRNTKWVFTGSHNYDDSSLRENDEALLRISSGTIHDQYRRNFWAMRDRAVPVT